MQEFVETEKAYYSDLQVILLYRTSAIEQKVLSNSDLDILFGEIERFSVLSQEVSAVLQAAEDQIGRLFSELLVCMNQTTVPVY